MRALRVHRDPPPPGPRRAGGAALMLVALAALAPLMPPVRGARAADAAAPATQPVARLETWPAERPVKLGVLAYRGDDYARAGWQPTAD